MKERTGLLANLFVLGAHLLTITGMLIVAAVQGKLGVMFALDDDRGIRTRELSVGEFVDTGSKRNGHVTYDRAVPAISYVIGRDCPFKGWRAFAIRLCRLGL